MAGSSEVARFLDSLREATRVLDAYTARVRDGTRANEQAARAAVRSADVAGPGLLARGASAIGGVAEDAGMSVAAKATTLALNELSAIVTVIAREAFPGMRDAIAGLEDAKKARAQTIKFAQDLNDQGISASDDMIRNYNAYVEHRENMRTVTAQEVERALGTTGDSMMLENMNAQKKAKPGR